jgi:hypothetical protein
MTEREAMEKAAAALSLATARYQSMWTGGPRVAGGVLLELDKINSALHAVTEAIGNAQARAALAAEGRTYWRVEHRTLPSLTELTTPFPSRGSADKRVVQLTNLFPDETPRSWKIVRVTESEERA